jgi:hypothetical protein
MIDSSRLPQQGAIEREYERIQRLIQFAEQGDHLDQYGGQYTLYLEPDTLAIRDASTGLFDLLGYTREALLSLCLHDIEVLTADSAQMTRHYVESSIEEQVYAADYRHRLGHTVSVQVHKRMLYRPEGRMLYIRLEDQSLHQRLWHELQRREDSGFIFQQKLKILNEITHELNQLDSFDALCRAVVEYSITRLGFDRVGLWFVDAEQEEMVGSYGVDEQGGIRAEHGQRWKYAHTYIEDYAAGRTEASYAHDEVPIYNHQSEIIQYGWHISAPILHDGRFIGVLSSDNFLNKQPMRNYEPELLRLYGITVGHLTELFRAREHNFAMRLQEERNRLLKDFIVKIGHDFRTPLSVINTNSYLAGRVQDETRKQYR